MDQAGTPLSQRVDDLTGRVMAWVGGLAVVLGIAFLFAIGVSNGWIGELARTLFAGAGSALLVAIGVWLRERKAHTDAAFAATAAGLAGAFVTVTVAARVYELLPALGGVALAIVVGGLGTALALRWRSQGLAALGVLGAIVAPLLADAPSDGGTIAILFVAVAAAAAVVVWQRWRWLAVATLALSVPQWATFVLGSQSPAEILLALIAFGGLGVAVAIGYDLRTEADRIDPVPAFLLALNALAVALVGWLGLDQAGDPTAADAWLAALAVAHVAVGLAGRRVARLSADLGALSVVLGMVLANVAFALIAGGLALTLGWAVASVCFAALLRRSPAGSRDERLAAGGLGAHLSLATIVALADDSVGTFLGGAPASDATGVVGLAALAAAFLISGRLADGRTVEGGVDWRIALDGLGLAVVALLTATALTGADLALAWIAEAAVLTAMAHHRNDRVAGWGALGFLTLAAGTGLVYAAPPEALVAGLDDPVAALAAVGGVAAVALAAARLLPDLRFSELPSLLTGAGALALLYLGSCLVVTPFESGAATDTALLSAHQQGQMGLSVFWAAVGVAALAVGLSRDMNAVRYSALALLAVAVGKVFLLDLANLTSVYRVVSFIALGLLLLVGAFVWQRLRPQVLPDLRDAPPSLR